MNAEELERALKNWNTRPFGAKARDYAKWLVANHMRLTKKYAEDIADLLECSAELVERLELQNEELILTLDARKQEQPK